MAETFDWIKPSLLWQENGQDMLNADFLQPRLLEFRSDNFVPDFLAAASAPRPDAFRQAIAQPARTGASLKLFQPAHGNFYLACGSLCCRMPGFPDREVQRGEGEQVFFVLRKQVNGAEYAWKTGETEQGWKPLNGQAASVLDGEERLPLFPATTAKNRALFYGYVPVSSQESYAAAPDVLPTNPPDSRIEELRGVFIDPLKNAATFGISGAAADAITIQRISVYLLLGLWEYFKQYVQQVADQLRGDASAAPNTQETALITFMQGQRLGGTLDLATALGNVARQQDYLNQPGDSDLQGFSSDYTLKNSTIDTNQLEANVNAALQSRPAARQAQVKLPKLGQKADDFYVLRFVYERSQCEPVHHYVSQPTERFQLAPFFDPDAPARPIRIGLPVDVSIGGLRKFKKNVAFLMSTELRKKLSSVKPEMLKGDGPQAEDPNINIGHICSFSIPIITLCAFILLMIIVIILNLIFWWIPLLKICFPLKLSAK